MSLRVNLEGNASGFKAMLGEARLRAKEFGRDISHDISSEQSRAVRMMNSSFLRMFTGLGVFEAAKRGLESFIDMGHEIKDMSDQIGMSTDSWQKWADALDRAGLSSEGFQRVVGSLQQKRTEALTDPKARGELNRLGFSDTDISGDMSTDEFLKRALGNASKGDLQRSYLSNVIGSLGMRYGSVLDQLPNARADFSPQDIKDSEEAATALKDLKKSATEAGLAIYNNLTGKPTDQTRTFSYWKAALFTPFYTYGSRGLHLIPNFWSRVADKANADEDKASAYQPVKSKRSVRDALDERRAWEAIPVPHGMMFADAEARDAWKREQYYKSQSKPADSKSTDPMDDVLAKQQEEFALAQQSRKWRMDDSARGLMTIGDRRKAIMDEVAGLLPQIADRQAKAKGEGFLTDADKKDLEGVTGKARDFLVDKLRMKYQTDTDDLVLREQHNEIDLRQKPLNFGADTLSKVGLYSATSLPFNPLLSIGERTNRILTSIDNKLTPRSNGQTPAQQDHHAP